MPEVSNISLNISEKATVIWNIANALVGYFKPHEYGTVILPMTVIKRFHDCLLPNHQKMLDTYEDVKNFEVIDGFMQGASGYQFYNTSKFTFEKLVADSKNIESNFKDYIAGFSSNVQDILTRFDFDTVLKKIVESGALYVIIKEFNSERGYLGPDKVSAVDCGYIFEELVRRFSESYGEDAGAHFTSRDIIYTMTDILLSDADLSDLSNVTVYDQTMGTSQMLTCMEERIHALNSEIDVNCFGQEFNPSTFAIAKSDMMIRGGDSNNMRFGDTLDDDQFKGFTFKYGISNPPFGIDWKKEQDAVEREADLGDSGRFPCGLPKISDGQQLFMLNGISKMADDGRMAIIQNGSPLFSGDAGSGPSNIRQYMLENDWLDAIIQLSSDAFMNTPIQTYIWILDKNKSLDRAGKVQLIDASHCYEPRRKSIGNKRNDITDRCRELIVKAYSEFRNDAVYAVEDNTEIYCESKIFDSVEFGYNKIVVERPLRYLVTVNEEAIKSLSEDIKYIKNEKKRTDAYNALDVLKTMVSENSYSSYDKFCDEFTLAAKKVNKNSKLKYSTVKDVFNPYICKVDPNAEIVHEKGEPVADVNLRDTENVPLVEDIDAYFEREVLPYADDAWIDRSKTKVGYEIPMTRYFYKYQQPESSDAIYERIIALEGSISESLKNLFHKEG